MKKLFIVLSVFLLSLSLTACGSNEPVDDKEPMVDEQEPDVITSASQATNGEELVSALSKDGTWIGIALNDITYDKEIIVEGEFTNRDVIARKIALYASDEDHKKIASYTLTAPKLIIKSENFLLKGGTFVGDVYVEAPGFKLQDAMIKGNLYFKDAELRKSSTFIAPASVTGKVLVDDVDVFTSASFTIDPEGVVNATSENGAWITVLQNNITLTEDLIVEGEFTNRDVIARKIALYGSDENKQKNASYTLTVPKLIIRSENFLLKGGTLVGDVYVEANGFKLEDATIEGNLYFASEEYMDSMIEDETGTVTGEKAVME